MVYPAIAEQLVFKIGFPNTLRGIVKPVFLSKTIKLTGHQFLPVLLLLP